MPVKFIFTDDLKKSIKEADLESGVDNAALLKQSFFDKLPILHMLSGNLFLFPCTHDSCKCRKDDSIMCFIMFYKFGDDDAKLSCKLLTD